MRDYVARPRPELTAQARAGRAHLAGMVPQLHEPGAEAEVDFCEALVIVAGKPMKTYLFTLRLSYSGKSVHRVFASQGQEAFMEGHVEAFHIPGPPRQPLPLDRFFQLDPVVVGQQQCVAHHISQLAAEPFLDLLRGVPLVSGLTSPHQERLGQLTNLFLQLQKNQAASRVIPCRLA